jgi:hypothetical protein
MDRQKILVPYNFTANDEKCLRFVVERYKKNPGVEITLFHAYSPVPSVEISDKTVMQRVSGGLSYLRQKISENEKAIQDARADLIRAGFAEDMVSYVFKVQKKDVAQEIVDYVRENRFTTILLNRSPVSIANFFTVSVSQKVTKALKGLTIYTVT